MQKGIQLVASISLSLGVLFGTYALAYAQSMPPLPFPPQMQQQNLPLPQLNLNGKGLVHVVSAKVTAVSSSTISATQSWGSYAQNWTLEIPSSGTKNGISSEAVLSSISVGDAIGFAGSLDTAQSAATVKVSALIDYTHKAQPQNPGNGYGRGHGHGRGNATSTTSGIFSGTVSSVDSSNASFVLATGSGNLTVTTNGSTLITNGAGSTSFSSITAGASVVRAFGTLNSASSTLAATEIDLAQTAQITSPVPADHLFSGTLNAIASTTAPTTITLNATSTTYTVNVASTTALLGYNWNPIALSQVRSGDSISILGRAEQGNASMLDAYVLRDQNVQ